MKYINLKTFGKELDGYCSNHLKSFPQGIHSYIKLNIVSLCNYEEEEVKIKPNLLIGIDIDKFMLGIEGLYCVKLIDHSFSEDKVSSYLKSIIPICIYGWTAYINLNSENNCLEYGVIKGFSEFSLKSFGDLVFEHEETNQFVYFSVLSKNKLYVKASKETGYILHVSYSFPEENKEDPRKPLVLFFNTCFSSNALTNEVKRASIRLSNKLYTRIHGCICVVVDKNSDLKQMEIFKSDIKILDKPIDLYKFISPLIDKEEGRYIDVMSYNSMIELLLSLMNLDGICILDNSFKIRGYNCFIKSNNSEVAGGARLRTFNTIINSGEKNIIGCYTQSQDGNSKFKNCQQT